MYIKNNTLRLISIIFKNKIKDFELMFNYFFLINLIDRFILHHIIW